MRKRFAAVLAAGLLSGALAAGQGQKITLAIGYIPHVQFTPLYVGMEKGFYAREGIDLEINYGFGMDIFALLQAGRIDLGLSDSDQLILSGAKNLGLKAVFQYYQEYPVSIVAKADGISEPKDLEGRTIGTPELYGTSFIGLQLFLRHYGLAEKVKVVKIGYTQEASLLGDKVDAVVCFSNNEPLRLRLRGVAIKEWEVREFTDVVGASFISSSGIIGTRGELLEAFARATRRAMAYTVENQEESLSIAFGRIGNLKQEDKPFFRQVLAATCRLFPNPKGYGYLDPEKYRDSIRTLAGIGLIPEEYPAERIVWRPGE
jgi:NitT/TauT family transport system substrate-binding protein